MAMKEIKLCFLFIAIIAITNCKKDSKSSPITLVKPTSASITEKAGQTIDVELKLTASDDIDSLQCWKLESSDADWALYYTQKFTGDTTIESYTGTYTLPSSDIAYPGAQILLNFKLFTKNSSVAAANQEVTITITE
jgi:hypothetical protein